MAPICCLDKKHEAFYKVVWKPHLKDALTYGTSQNCSFFILFFYTLYFKLKSRPSNLNKTAERELGGEG